MSHALRVEAVRNGFTESVHQVNVVVTSPEGEPLEEWGDTMSAMLPRSANKPIQALGMLRSGLDHDDPTHLALACASHSGEPYHLAGVLEILAQAGLGVEDLGNTPDFPLDDTARHATGDIRTSLFQNCSGKHASMVATCVVNGWDTRSYLDPSHPLQQAILYAFQDLGITPDVVAVDGCGAPAHSMTLTQLAHVYGRFASTRKGDVAQIADAMRSHPEYVGGTNRPNTVIMQQVAGVIAKDGAEGVFAVGLDDGRGIAVKVVDGNKRAAPVVVGAVLQYLHVGDERLWARLDESAPVLGHGKPVGSLQVLGLVRN